MSFIDGLTVAFILVAIYCLFLAVWMGLIFTFGALLKSVEYITDWIIKKWK